MTQAKERGAFEVRAGAIARLRAIAVSLGLIATSGIMVGRGSISAMLQAIVDGRLRVTWAEGKAPEDAQRE